LFVNQCSNNGASAAVRYLIFAAVEDKKRLISCQIKRFWKKKLAR